MNIGFLVNIEFTWGFECRIAGLSKTSPSFYYPPPSTFLGALGESISKNNNIGEDKGKEIITELSKNLLAIGFKPINCIPIKYEDIGRIITIKITERKLKPDPKDLTKSFDSPARGKTLLVSLNNEPPSLVWGLIFKNNKIQFNNKEIKLKEDYFWQIHRLGSKESRISVNEIKTIEKIEIVENKNIVTSYSFPLFPNVKLKYPLKPEWKEELYTNPFKIKFSSDENPVINYTLGKNIIRYKIPISMIGTQDNPKYLVKVSENCVGYKLIEDEALIGIKK